MKTQFSRVAIIPSPSTLLWELNVLPFNRSKMILDRFLDRPNWPKWFVQVQINKFLINYSSLNRQKRFEPHHFIFHYRVFFFISKIRIRDPGSMFRNEEDPDPGKTTSDSFNLFPQPSSTEYSVGSTPEQELLILEGRKLNASHCITTM